MRILTPAILTLTLLYVLLSLSTNSIGSFSVSALVGGYGVNLTWANAAVTAFLFARCLRRAGRRRAGRPHAPPRHGGGRRVRGRGRARGARRLRGRLPDLALVLCLGATGFLTGVITPSRDMLVRAAAPPGAEGRAFGIVSTGFNIGGAVGPMLFGWLLDRGHFSGVFWAAVVFDGADRDADPAAGAPRPRAPRPLSRPAAG